MNRLCFVRELALYRRLAEVRRAAAEPESSICWNAYILSVLESTDRSLPPLLKPSVLSTKFRDSYENSLALAQPRNCSAVPSIFGRRERE